MQEYSISKSSRKCSISGRGLEPGEKYFSVIVPDGEHLSRIDIAGDQWTGSYEGAIGWWRNKMPDAAALKSRPAPNGVLLDTLSDLLERPGKETLAYLLALLLIRRRVLHEDTQLDGEQPGDARTTWNLMCPADGRHWNVPIAIPLAENVQELQEELKGLLFTDA